jgi:N-acetylated-alpha-linked acidic dipeptidase
MIGNHKDSWTQGSIDPNSATAVLLEVSRSLMQLKQANMWTPKRSVIFFGWSAEEYGLLGSTEWVEVSARQLHSLIYIKTSARAYFKKITIS